MRHESHSFTVAVGGYHVVEVEDRVAALEAELDRTRVRLQAVDGQCQRLTWDVVTAQQRLRDVARPTYAGLGVRIEEALFASEERARELITSAVADADETRADARAEAEQVLVAAARAAQTLRTGTERDCLDLVRDAHDTAEATVAEATGRAPELLAAAGRWAAKLAAVTDQDTGDAPATLERELMLLRTRTGRLVAQLRAEAQRDNTALLAVARRHSHDARAAASAGLEQARITFESRVGELEAALAARSREAQRSDATRHEPAVARARRLAVDAEARAADAERSAAEASDRADGVRRAADRFAEQLGRDTDRDATHTLAQAQAAAAALLAETATRADVQRRTLQQEVADLVTQRDLITEQFTQLRHLLTAARPGE